MKKSLIALAALAACGASFLGRAQTHDVAFTYRMGAGFPGDVNRTHPASILPGLMDVTNPVAAYGYPVLINGGANSYRGIIAADQAGGTKIMGVLVRPYPTQQMSGGMSSAIGAATPPTSGVVDVLREGFILVQVGDFAANPPVKGGAVFVWSVASAGVHTLGGFEVVASAGNTFPVANARWNGPPDASGVAEIEVWAA